MSLNSKLMVPLVTIIFSLLLMNLGGPRLQSEASPVLQTTGNDWPMLMHDPQRTGYTTEEVRPPYTYLWKWNEVPFAGRTQPVVADGRLFIGGLDGVMYARNAHTGAPLWSYPTDGPIRHSAAIYHGRVFFGSHDSYIYALDTTSGVLIWRYKTGAGIAAAPVVADSTVYIGSTDGIFYALKTGDGNLRWAYDAGAPILTSAALSVDGTTVYFGAENIKAYALNTADGSLRWQTQLQGQSLADRWPVVIGDLVIYCSQSLRHFHSLLHDGDDVMDQAGPYGGHTFDPAVWAADWARVRPQIVSYLGNNPDRQTFFALESNTGNLRGVAPVLFTYGNGDAPAPPTVRGNQIYSLYRARHGIQTDSGSVHVTTRYDAELGRMDPNTLDITGLIMAPGQNWNVHFRATSDEPEALSMGGSMLFVDNWERLGGIDVDTGELFEVANVAADWPECYVQCQAKSGPMPFFDSYPFPGPRIGEGHQRSGVVIAEGVIYWRVIEGALAAIGHADGGQTQTYLWPADKAAWEGQYTIPDEVFPGISGVPITSSPPFSTYVWSPPPRPVPVPPSDLAARLEDELQAVVSAGHLAPFFLERGFTSPEAIPGDSTHPEDGLCSFKPGNVYWFDPGELIYTLSLAYPYLSPGLQTQVRTYLRDEMARYSPLERLPWPPDWMGNGTRRESYPVTFLANVWPPPAPPLSTLYALWVYADATGDWGYLQDHWPQIDALFDAKKDQVDSYGAISGAIGYARIAQHLGHASEAQEGENVAVAAMAAGQDFNAFLTTANTRYPDSCGGTFGYRAPAFFGLVPEVGLYLHDYVYADIEAYLSTFTDYYNGDYLWHLTRLGLQQDEGESSFHGPELAWSIFLAKAYVQGAKRTELRHYLDRPWGLGDLYYIQKLIAAIEADDSPDLSSSTMVASVLTPQFSDVFIYTINLHNSGCPLTYTVTLTDSIPAGLDYVPGSLTATSGIPAHEGGIIHWSGLLSDTLEVALSYAVTVTTETAQAIQNIATIDVAPFGIYTRTATIIANGYSVYLPLVFRRR